MTDSMDRGPLTPEESRKLEDYLAERLPPDRRAEVEREILASEKLSEALYAEVNLRGAMEEAGSATLPGRVPAARPRKVVPIFPRWARIALPLAALLLIAVLSPRLFRPTEDDELGRSRRFRSGVRPPPSVAQPRGLSPSGDVLAVPSRFVWSRVPRATSYHVELLGASGEVLFSTDSADTSIDVLRDAFPPDPTLVTAWRVIAVEESGMLWSEPVPLHVGSR